MAYIDDGGSLHLVSFQGERVAELASLEWGGSAAGRNVGAQRRERREAGALVLVAEGGGMVTATLAPFAGMGRREVGR